MITLNNLYSIFIVLGILLPILNLVFGFIDGICDFDIGLDGDADIGILGFNFNCLLFSLLVFGSVGKITLTVGVGSLIISFVVALLFGVICYIISYRFIFLPLKTNKSLALNSRDLIGKSVTVESKIPVGRCGEVYTNDSTGCKITYIADYEYTDAEEVKDIMPGTIVIVTGIKHGILIVGKQH